MNLGAPVRLELWRDRDPAAMRLPDMFVGEIEIREDPLGTLARLAAAGARFARLREPVDLAEADGGGGGAAAMSALVVVRELTGHGVAVDWTVRLAASADWQPLSHLFPPSAVLAEGDLDAAAVAARWRGSFHLAKCGYRHGPGFIEVRDHRTDSFRRLVIRQPRHENVIQPLLVGVPATDLAVGAAARYERAGLVHRAGRYLWWTPYRIRHWPLSTTVP